MRHGVLSKQAVLPWEDRAAFDALSETLHAEHAPAGPTEAHLVDELTHILWPKHRIQRAELASYQNRLFEKIDSAFGSLARSAVAHLADRPDENEVSAAVKGNAEKDAQALAAATARAEAVEAAIALVDRDPGSLEAAKQKLNAELIDWWREGIADGEWRGGGADLYRFLVDEPRTYVQSEIAEVRRRPLIRQHVFDAALNPAVLDRLARYETHLDRKFERTLAMLLRLQSIRADSEGNTPQP